MKIITLCIITLVSALGACAASDDTDRCVFDGRYDIGVDWSEPGYRPECGLFARTIFINSEEDECFYSGRDTSVSGDRVQLTFSCDAGNPVVECMGYADSSNGCSWPVYVRRVVQ